MQQTLFDVGIFYIQHDEYLMKKINAVENRIWICADLYKITMKLWQFYEERMH